jgi:hypothetical protein
MASTSEPTLGGSEQVEYWTQRHLRDTKAIESAMSSRSKPATLAEVCGWARWYASNTQGAGAEVIRKGPNKGHIFVPNAHAYPHLHLKPKNFVVYSKSPNPNDHITLMNGDKSFPERTRRISDGLANEARNSHIRRVLDLMPGK